MLLVVASVGLSVGALELVLRVGVERYRCDDRVGWTYRRGARVFVFNRGREFAHFVTFNRDGWRDRALESGADPGAFRVVLMGDSFGAGLQVPAEETFGRVLETRLNADATSGPRIEVWNASVDGFGTGQVLRLFEERVASLEPRLVFLGLFLLNDLSDNVFEAGGYNHHLALRCGRPYYQLTPTGELVEQDAGAPLRQRPGSRLDRLLRRSALYANFFPAAGRSGASFEDWDVITGANPAHVAAAWQLTQALVSDLDRKVSQGGGKLVLLLLPSVEEASVGPASDSAAAADRERLDRAHALSLAFVRESGIAHVDLYQALRGAIGGGERPYFSGDMHWNTRGHALVAETLTTWLAEHCAELDVPLRTCGP
jgi:lysophospholipase L1-like esterase